jgi:hypothetical protein
MAVADNLVLDDVVNTAPAPTPSRGAPPPPDTWAARRELTFD